MSSNNTARSIARAVLAAGGSAPKPYSALTYGEQAVIAAEADRRGLSPEAWHASAAESLVASQAAEVKRAADELALARAIREAQR